MLAKKFKLNIKNTQLAEAVNIGQLKKQLSSKKKESQPEKEEAPAEKKEKKPEAAAAPAAETPKAISKPKEAAATPPPKKVEPAPAPKVETSESNEEEAETPPPPPAVKVRSKTAEDIAKKQPAKAPAHRPAARASYTIAPKKSLPLGKPPVRLGPTGRHINDILPQKKKAPPKEAAAKTTKTTPQQGAAAKTENKEFDDKPKKKWTKEYKNLRPRSTLKPAPKRKQDLRDASDEGSWRRRRPSRRHGGSHQEEAPIIRPKELSVRLPITVKSLAQQMKRKASEIISKLFMEGLTVTLNDFLDDETTIQLIGHEFDCNISINNEEEERIRITEKSIQEEIESSDEGELALRAPVVTFMGHVDHGKTSLIDKIRASNVAGQEAGAITQHIGAFRVDTSHGPLTFLDTPGHEAFTAMRARGAKATDIVVLVVAGDEGFRQQTEEALQHAKAAGVIILVAINKSDKPGFNADNVYRQLADHELLPEAWGGTTITVNCSAKTGDGLPELLELLALQAEVLELKANASVRARGTVLESEMHKGLGASVSLLIQNGTLRKGDALVFDQHWARVKTMRNCSGKSIKEAPPSTPVEITGLSGLPEAGEEFIAVKSEREAKEIADVRQEELRQKSLQKRTLPSMDSLLKDEGDRKKLLLVLRADVQGSLEALKASIENIESEKVDVEVVFSGVGEISESDVRLAAASQAVIIGFHTRVENHAAELIKTSKIVVKTYDVIYHALEGIKEIMTGLLDTVEVEHERGEAYVQATFKASQLGVIAGCIVKDGIISRNHFARLYRDNKEIWKGGIASIRRDRDDAKEVKKGLECGILLENFHGVEEGDTIRSFEIEHVSQEL